MSVYSRHVLPWLIRQACALPAIARHRAQVVPLARGRVLEIGAGGGLNLPHYDRAGVDCVLGLDPSGPLLARAEAEARRLGLRFEPVLADAAAIPLLGDSVDSVVVTFTLCSIPDLPGALAEIRRVLRPGGSLLFCEHGQAPEPRVARIQRLIEPVWKPLAGGCHLTRDPVDALHAAGFAIEPLDQGYLPRAWRGVGYLSWGVAR